MGSRRTVTSGSVDVASGTAIYDSPFGPVLTFPLEHVLTGQISVH